nr:hypothetical protein [Myxococcota bacterium]
DPVNCRAMSPGRGFRTDSTLCDSRPGTRRLCVWVTACLLVASLVALHGHPPRDALHDSVVTAVAEQTDTCSICSLTRVEQSAPELPPSVQPTILEALSGPTAIPARPVEAVARAHPPRAPPSFS